MEDAEVQKQKYDTEISQLLTSAAGLFLQNLSTKG